MATADPRPERHGYDSRLVALVYAAVCLLVYGRTLNTFFLSDDFYFLDLVSRAPGILVSFDPLVGRFVRPLIVALFYISYHMSGLAPWTYRVALLSVHWFTACLLYLVFVRLAGARDARWAALAGLIFVVFSGHSEGVVWLGGGADPLMAAAVTAAVYCYLRAVEPGSPRPWIAGYWTAIAFATLAKETWVILPGILLAHALTFGLPRDTRCRAAFLIGGATATAVLFLAVHWLLFHSVTGGFSARIGQAWIDQRRAFQLRCVLPAGRVAYFLWLKKLDLLGWPLGAIVVALTARGRDLRVIGFAALALLASLVPTVLLTISVTTTESERYIYLPTFFSCALVVWTIRAVSAAALPGPRLGTWTAIALSAAFAAQHATSLVRRNAGWVEAGGLARGLVDSFAAEVRRLDPAKRDDVYLLNHIDNLRGYFVLRSSFDSAVRLVHPDMAGPVGRMVGVATQTIETPSDAVRVTRRGDRGFSVDLGRNLLVQATVPSSAVFHVSNQTARSYDLDFSDALGRALVLYVTSGRFRTAGIVEGPAAPFGEVIEPALATLCDRDRLRIAGWALQRSGPPRVRIEEGDDRRLLGWAQQDGGMPGAIAPWYRAYPGTTRAGWSFVVSCEEVRRAPGGVLRLRIVVEGSSGSEGVLGERLVRASPAAAPDHQRQ